MTEETTGNESQKPEMSLDELAASLATQEAPQPKAEAPKLELPSMDDPDGFKQAVETSTNEFAQKLQQVNDFIDSQNAAQAKEKLQSDLNAAVDFVAGEIEGVDKRIVKAVLKDEADENPAFKKIWDMRDQNPAALQAALKHLSKQYSEQLAPKVDAEVAANQRAFQQSVQKARAGQLDELAQHNAQYDKMSDAEFDAEWAKLTGHGV